MAQLRVESATVVVPSGSITDDFIGNPAGSTPPISASKLEHKFKAGSGFGVQIGDAPVAREELVFVAQAAGTIRNVRALLNVTGSAGNITVDCKVNGASVLSQPIQVASTNTDREVIDGSISQTGLTAGDVVSLQLAVAGSDGTGPYAWVEVNERE